ncbi:hypothetical protein G6F57_020536 [Rhizopus arrhizus]|nr:hypothetical protein G6F57_020536 [Rhizopus arrhizus]
MSPSIGPTIAPSAVQATQTVYRPAETPRQHPAARKVLQQRCQAGTHQQVAAVDQRGDRDDQRDMRRRGPQLDRGEFRAAGKVEAGHQWYFKGGQALLCGLGAEHQGEGNEADHHRHGGAQAAQEFGTRGGVAGGRSNHEVGLRGCA